MSNSYTIGNTDGSKTITILAGSTNGNVVGSANTDTDLLLYGRGTFNWGAGIEQNLIRLTENWASPAENPTAALNAQYPVSFAPTPNQGITKPIIGQTWFNKSNNRTYVNVDGENNSGSWRIDAEGKYLSLAEGGTVLGNIVVTNDSPDIFIRSTATNFSNNSHLFFEGTDSNGDIKRTALIFTSNITNSFRIRNYDNDGTDVLSEIILHDDAISFNHVPAIMTQTIQEIDATAFDRVLTTREYVFDKIDDAIDNAPYLPLTGGTLTGNVTIAPSSGKSQLNIEVPGAEEGGVYISDFQTLKTSFKLLQGSFSTPAIPSATGFPATQDTVAIEKYSNGGANLQAMYFLDTHIETHNTVGKIRTPATDIVNDDDNTVVTNGSAKGYFHRGGNNLLIDQNNTATLTMRSPIGNLLQMNAESGATQDSRIDFLTEGSLRGKIALNENYPSGNLDTLVMQKWTGTTLRNSLEINDDSTLSYKPIEIKTSNWNGRLDIYAENDSAISNNYIAGDDVSDRTGILFRNQSGDVAGTILTANGGPAGLKIKSIGVISNTPSETELTFGYTNFTGNKEILMVGDATHDATAGMLFTNALAQKIAVARRTLKDTGYIVSSVNSIGKDNNGDLKWYSGDDPNDIGGNNTALTEYPSLQFDNTDKSRDYFTETFSSPDHNFDHALKCQISIPYVLIANGTGANEFIRSIVEMQYRNANANGNFGGWRDLHVSDIYHDQVSSVAGQLSFTVRVPCNPNQFTQLRFASRFGPLGGGTTVTAAYDYASVGPVRIFSQVI